MPAALSLSALFGVGLSSGTALAASNCTLTGSQLQATSNPAYDIDANGYNLGGGTLSITDTGCASNFTVDTETASTITFQFATTRDTVANLDLGPLTSYAVAEGYLPAADYLIDMEAGFELWSGGSGVAVNNFAVGVKGTTAVTVPNEVGRTDLSTAEAAITAAGLVPVAAGDSGVGNKGSVTSESPAAGSVVATGSSVTLTYTVKG
jgi:hypothetical protein